MAGNCEIPCYACKCSCNPVRSGDHPQCQDCEKCEASDTHEAKWAI